MNHTTQDLLDIARLYFPRISPSDPGYDQTPEAQRQRDAYAKAIAQNATWKALLRGIEAQMPTGVTVQNLSLFIGSPASWDLDRCFSAYVHLPSRRLTLRVSFVVPYFTIRDEVGDVTGDEEPAAMAIEAAVPVFFPGYEAMPGHVGSVVVPGVQVGPREPGEATLFDCLFSHTW